MQGCPTLGPWVIWDVDFSDSDTTRINLKRCFILKVFSDSY